jgi:hypothetical protein
MRRVSIAAVHRLIGEGFVVVTAISGHLADRKEVAGGRAWMAVTSRPRRCSVHYRTDGHRACSIPMLRPAIVTLTVLSFVGKMMIFDLVWIMTRGGPLWSTETVSTYVYKRAFDWNTFDLGYPSAIAVLWFLIILAFVVLMTQLLRQRARLEF